MFYVHRVMPTREKARCGSALGKIRSKAFLWTTQASLVSNISANLSKIGYLTRHWRTNTELQILILGASSTKEIHSMLFAIGMETFTMDRLERWMIAPLADMEWADWSRTLTLSRLSSPKKKTSLTNILACSKLTYVMGQWANAFSITETSMPDPGRMTWWTLTSTRMDPYRMQYSSKMMVCNAISANSRRAWSMVSELNIRRPLKRMVPLRSWSTKVTSSKA